MTTWGRILCVGVGIIGIYGIAYGATSILNALSPHSRSIVERDHVFTVLAAGKMLPPDLANAACG